MKTNPVAKGRQPVEHDWRPTDRMIPGAVLKLHACISCKPAHVKAYDMVLTGGRMNGALEYELRSQHA